MAKTRLTLCAGLLVMATLIFSGCATTGAIPSIKEGKTTKSDLVTRFGEADAKQTGTDGEEWHYRFAKDRDAATLIVMNLKIVFDGDYVKGYEVQISEEKRPDTEDAEKKYRDGEAPPPRPVPPRYPPPAPRPFPPFR